MMDEAIIIQKRVRRRADGTTQALFAVTAMALQTPDGRKLIPHPAGQEAAMFTSMEEAEQAIAQAGFDAMFEGRRLPSARRLADTSTRRALSPTHEPFEALGTLLLKALSDREAAVVANAALALGELGDARAIPALIPHLGDDDPTARKAIAEALGKLGARTLPALEEAYRVATQHPHENNAVHTRLTIVMAYQDMLRSHREALFQVLPPLHTALGDPHWLVRSQAAQAVAQAARLWQDGQWQPAG